MGTRVTRGAPLQGYTSNSRRRKTVLEVDLNVPPSENRDQEGSSAHPNFILVEPSAPIDVEAFDDDVVISSPRAFAQAKRYSRQRRGRTVVVDVDSEARTSGIACYSRTRRRRVSDLTSGDLYINLDIASTSRTEDVQSVKPSPPPPPPPPPKEPIFKCPICMGPFIEAMSTKCGHIFCKACLKAAISSQGKCPTCRRKGIFKDAIRVYLPASD